MVEVFKKYVEKHELIQPKSQTLLAVSGGLDSMVMAELFQKSGFPFAIAHCNFQLRGEESDGDETFVIEWAATFGVKCYVKKFETDRFSKENKLSIQVAARQLRYEWFGTFYPEYPQLAVAHHQNDALETMVYNLAKGTGLAGIRGIKPKNGHIIRPLLFASRRELEEYAQKNGIQWREDSSNASHKYARNLIRHEIIPVLKKINPSIEKTSVTTFDRLATLESFIQQTVKEKEGVLYSAHNEGISIQIKELQSLSHPILFLSELIRPFGFSYHDCLQILTTLDNSESKRFLSETFELVKDRGVLWVKKINAGDSESIVYEIDEQCESMITEQFHLKIQKRVFTGEISILDKNTVWMDKGKLVFPLIVRKWQEGDSFQPFGMKGRKKLSDFLMDEKLSKQEKENTWVLCSAEEIVWVVGMRMSEKVKVSEKTTEYVEIGLINTI